MTVKVGDWMTRRLDDWMIGWQNFGERHVVSFLKLKNVKNTFDSVTAENPQIGPILGVSSLIHLHCKSTKLL